MKRLWAFSWGYWGWGNGRRGLKVVDPKRGVDELLQLVAHAGEQRRRVIFFCACEWPRHCHRGVVARLLVNSASRKGIPLSVAEWPGEEPRIVKLEVSESVVNEVLRGGSRVPLDGLSLTDLHKLTALPVKGPPMNWTPPTRASKTLPPRLRILSSKTHVAWQSSS
jgi:hypothetical protein